MKIKYKRIKVAMPHCGNCGEELRGNGSEISPYKCKCGTWKNSLQDLFEYQLMK